MGVFITDEQLDSIKEQIKVYLNLKFIGSHKIISGDIFFKSLGMGVGGRENTNCVLKQNLGLFTKKLTDRGSRSKASSLNKILDFKLNSAVSTPTDEENA